MLDCYYTNIYSIFDNMQITSGELAEMIKSLPDANDFQHRTWKVMFPVMISPILVTYKPEIPCMDKTLDFTSKRFNDGSFRWVIDL